MLSIPRSGEPASPKRARGGEVEVDGEEEEDEEVVVEEEAEELEERMEGEEEREATPEQRDGEDEGDEWNEVNRFSTFLPFSLCEFGC